MMQKIREIEQMKEEQLNEARDPKHWKLKKEDFKKYFVFNFSPNFRPLIS